MAVSEVQATPQTGDRPPIVNIFAISVATRMKLLTLGVKMIRGSSAAMTAITTVAATTKA